MVRRQTSRPRNTNIGDACPKLELFMGYEVAKESFYLQQSLIDRRLRETFLLAWLCRYR